MRSRGRPPQTTRTRRYSNLLGDLRRRLGLSQQRVAALAQISTAYYGALERGDKRINAEIAQRLQVPLQCAAGDLLVQGQGVSVPLRFAVAAAEAEARPERYELPEPYEWLHPGRLADAADCFAAELFDDSGDLDFAAGTVLIARPPPPQADTLLTVGDKIIARFFLDGDVPPNDRATHEILYGILDRNIVGDLMLITRTRNRMVPRNALIQSVPRPQGGFAERPVPPLTREERISYANQPEDPAEILGVVVYAMGPT